MTEDTRGPRFRTAATLIRRLGEKDTRALAASVVKYLAKKDPYALASAIEAAGPRATDNVYQELKLRRAGIDTSPENRARTQAPATAAVDPFRRALAELEKRIGATFPADHDEGGPGRRLRIVGRDDR